jgi:hypothetical protein
MYPIPIASGIQFGIDFGKLGIRMELQDAELYDQLGWKWHDKDKDIQTNQIGHFLTAVKLGYNPEFLDDLIYMPGPPDGVPSIPIYYKRLFLAISRGDDVETAAIKLIIGHELVGDPPPPMSASIVAGITGGFARQYKAAVGIDLFKDAVEADRDGNYVLRDNRLREIFSTVYDPDHPEGVGVCYVGKGAWGSPWKQGNSMQDFRLSVKGYRFGQEIRNGSIRTRSEAAQWLMRELAIQYY